MSHSSRVAALLVTVAASTALAAGKDVDLKAADGTVLRATYGSAGKPGPGVVLLHMCNSNRTAWAGLAEKLNATGIHTIALDYRGFGESGGPKPDTLPAAERTRQPNEVWPGDAYLAANDRPHAVEYARKAIDVLARDTRTPEDYKQEIRKSAEAKLKDAPDAKP